ncbi:MAG TPA: bifunctional glycosyltransferase family 2/GtrA family protein [Streptosporangiaceae bacterium]|nr:bifunctional glycosyltransferase family 2/GtrA family protein [Streptosporangiaceae bacterium]
MGSPERVLDQHVCDLRPPVAPAAAVQVEIVVPVRDEERDLGPSVRRLHEYLRERFPFTARITIADNGSTDATWSVALALAGELDLVRAVRLDQPGRGRALRSVWSASDAEVLAYMDVDLSTDLNALLPLVAPLLSGHSDVAIGTRLAPGARVTRGPRREVISRCYNLLLHATLRVRFSDAQCGFKAIRADRARPLLARTQDPGWFFDTELLVLAERAGLRIHEVPVDWTDDADSRVDLVTTALADLRGIVRLGGGGQLARFLGVGLACTAAYVLLYLVLRGAMAAEAANALSLLVTAVANTAVNRRFTFGVRGRRHAVRHQVRGLLAFGAGLLLTSAALAWLHTVSARPGRGAEVIVLAGANLLATILRFALYRIWVFRARTAPPGSGTSSPAAATTLAQPGIQPSIQPNGSAR